jgi:YD repeat-containing protein
MCTVADPINVATGNVYESETDYQDSDGELHYARYYNSSIGAWRFSYQTSLYLDPRALVITFEDGRSSVFSLSNGVATAEATELGTMTQSNGVWTYSSPTNEQFTFDTQGRLTRWKLANGLAQTLTYAQGANPGQATITVTDSRGHTLQINTQYGMTQSLVVGGLTVTYGLDSSWRLANVQHAWSGHTTSRSYLYEDAAHPRMLTGVINEKGVRSATWKYDTQGRAITNYGAGGVNQTGLAYNSDGTITVTNALGNSVTYAYQVIQGVNRVASIAGQPAVGCPASNSSYTYYPNGQVQTKTDALGNITAYTYDAQGREITRVEAKGTSLERTISTTWQGATFLPKTVTTADRVITYNYDGQNRLLSTDTHAIKE